MNKRKAISVIIEVLYYALYVLFLAFLKNKYSSPVQFDATVFIGFVFLTLGLMILCGRKLNKCLGMLFATLYALYFVAQKIYYVAFKSYFRFATAISLKDEVVGVSDTIQSMIHFDDFAPFVVIIIFTIAFMAISFAYHKDKIGKPIKIASIAISVLMIASSVSIVSNMQNTINLSKEGWDNFDIYKSDWYLYDKVNNNEAFVNKFGLLTFCFRDIETLFETNKSMHEDVSEIDGYFAQKSNDKKENDVTGIFQGKNIFIVQAESLMNLAIDEQLTPLLYWFKTSGIEFTNFETPVLVGSTSSAEFMANTSFIPETSGYSVCYDYQNNVFPVTMGNIFRNDNYTTQAYHNNYAEYYNRRAMFNKFGYEFFDSIDLGYENLESDSKVSGTIGWIATEIDKYLGFWITYSGHQPYNLTSTGVMQEYIDIINNVYPGLDDSTIGYLAKAMDLDNSLQQIFNIFGWNNKLNDIVFVIYGDHPAKDFYAGRDSAYDKVFGKNTDDNPELGYTPLFIFNYGGERITNNKFATALDILPTLSNMMGYDVDTKYMFGNDLFDEDCEGMSFDINGNIWNHNFYYDATNNSIECDASYKHVAERIVGDFNYKRYICNKILDSDYFSRIDQ